MFQTALHLVRKDLRIFFRDRTALLLALVLPIVLATVFGTAMKGMAGESSGGGIKPLPLLVEDRDDSEASRSLVARLEAQDGILVRKGTDAHSEVRNGDVAMALVIDKGYGEQSAAGKIPELRLLQDPSKMLSVQVLTARMMPALVQQTIGNAKGPLFRSFLADTGFPVAGIDRAEGMFQTMFDGMTGLAAELQHEEADGSQDAAVPTDAAKPAGGSGMDFLHDVPKLLGVKVEDVTQATTGPPKSAGVSHAFAAMAVMMLMFSMVAGAGTLLDEQDQGTLLRLRLVPRAGDAILLGKTLFLASIGALQLIVLFLFGMFVFDVPVLPNLFELAVISGATVFAVAGMGMLFATYSRTRKQLEGSSTLIILAMSALGGAWFPREMTPDLFQTLGKFTLTAWAMDAYHGVLWYGKRLWPAGELNGVWPQVAV
ncbi:MAG TPA: ABC transporter permease, partial [Planctomycetota bacterium]|nr:ABC transporter permease [Planctomycetota bacterium]